MGRYQFDLITIGAGSGGIAASRRAAAHGARVAICEAGRVGGTCVLRGCVPKKLLVYGAQVREEIDDAVGFGWSIAGARCDLAALISNKDQEIARLSRLYERLLHDAGVEIVRGHARLLDPHTVEVAGRCIQGEYILLATGSSPTRPAIPGIEHVISSDEALDLQTLPRHLVIVGGGYIAAEFASIFRGLGAEVTVVLRGNLLLRGLDQDLRSHLQKAMEQRGVRFLCDTVVCSIEREPDGRLSLLTNAGEILEADVVLYATGRAPHTAGMGLQEVGVRLTPRGGVLVDAWSRSSVENIYAVGDCSDRTNLTPVAIAQGRAVADSLFSGTPRVFDPTAVPTAVFSLPPLASVGLSEESARARHRAVDVYLSSFRPLKHALSGRDEHTLMKLVVDGETDRVLGCHMVGADAPEIIQGLAVALSCGATKAQLDATVGIHPTAAEEFLTMRQKRPPHSPGGAERGDGSG
ncbi:MAG: glutathione-disulfide reductase [Myxococcales bacterium]|nr:glutathione-disulfide reductase [Myxococcota bacterium]MDW8281431.1 glutathione-disulfide reductase [Myxococcales bacterium]